MARTLRAASSCCGFPSAFCPALRAWPSSGCSGQPSPRASSRVRQPLIRSTLYKKIRRRKNMGKSHDVKKGEKKQPVKTLKEKRLEKKSKKAGR
jgi:hypothetical protein